MFDKRLMQLVPGVVPYIIASVVAKVIALLMNVLVILSLGGLFGAMGTVALVARADGSPVDASIAMPVPACCARYLAPLAAAILVRAIAIYLAQRAGDRAAYLAKRTIRQRVYDKLAELGPAYAESVSTAEAVQTSVEGAQQLEVYFGGYLPQFFYAIIAPVVLFVCLIGLAPLPAAILMMMVPFIPASIMVVMRRAKRVAGEYWDTYVDLGGSFLEAVQGLTTLKIYQADARWHKRMNEGAEGFRLATMKMLGVQLSSITIMDLVAFGGAAAGIILAMWQLAMGAIGFTGAFAVVFLSQEFFLPMRRLGSLFHTAMNGMSAAKTMFRILDAPVPERGGAELDGTGDVVCAGVGYAYGDHVVLEGVDATIPRGSLTAIVGASGSGKSTLAGILSGHKAAYRGTLTIGGVDIRDASLDSLVRTVTLVPSAGHLFEGTLRSNLLLARPLATDDELWSVLARCRIDGFVRASGGLDMKVSEGGQNLSGGQRQRACVARALLRETPVFIFDEATSNVDAESERAIGQVIQELARDHTVLVIAHRLASVRDAAQILVIDRGRLVEHGTHEELLAAHGAYAALWESQASLESEARDMADAGEREGEPTVAAAAAGQAGRPVASTAVENGWAGSGMSSFQVMRRMVGLVSPLLPYLLLAIALGSAGSLAATLLATFGAYGLVDAVLSSHGLGVSLAAASVLVAACGVVRGPLRYGEQLCNHYIAFRLLAHVRDLVFAALRRLAPAKLEGRERGDLISLVTADIELLEVFYAHTISPVAIAIATSLVMLVFLGSYSLPIALLALAGYLVLGVALPLFSSKLCGDAGRASRDGAGAISAYVLDSLRGLAESIQFNGVAERSRGLAERTERVGAVDARLHRRSAAVEGLADALVLALSIGMIALSLAEARSGALSLPAAFVCSFAFFSSFGPVLAVARLGTSLQGTIASGARVIELLDEEPQTDEVPDGAGARIDPGHFGGASLEGVDFAYAASGEQILAGVSLKVPAGKMTCISGRSGSGKSTLLKLLMRFWDPTAGTVRVSGEDARRVETSSLRTSESYMTQDTDLFIGTIAENLRVAKADATVEELDAACAAAALTDFIARQPKGYDTSVAELGDSLSGGERQRIGLARVFLHDASLVLLDEPTSNLDALSEAAVMRAVSRLRDAGKTVVLVSHRASTVSFADGFYSVERGRLS